VGTQEGNLALREETIKVIVEMITRHCRLRKHLHTPGIASKPDCRKCGMEEETAHHRYNVRMPRNQIYQGQIVQETTPPT